MNTPREGRILVGRRDERVGRIGEGLWSVIAAVLDHQLEAARRTQALDGRRIDHDDNGVLDAGQALAHSRQHRRGVDAGDVLPYKRRQAMKIVPTLGAMVHVVTSNPVTGEVCSTPGVFRTMSFTSRTTASVRSRLEPGGRMTTTA